MGISLEEPRVRQVLEHMHAEADRVDPPLLDRARGKTGADRAAMLAEAFIPVDADAGRLLYALARNARPGLTVEFGTSYGISTIYLAAAVRDRGGGLVVTTEMNADKASRAREYIDDAGLLEFVDLRQGDALETLVELEPDVSLLFLDGMKNLYVPVLKLVEPALQAGALVIGDDIDLFPEALASYLDYVRDAANGYASVRLPIGDGMELSARG